MRDKRLGYVTSFHYMLLINTFDISNKNHCRLNSVIQFLFPILRTIGHTFQFNSSAKRSLSECLFDAAHSVSNSKDVDVLLKIMPRTIWYILQWFNAVRIFWVSHDANRCS